MSLNTSIKRRLRGMLVPLIYRYPPFAIQPSRLYVYLHYILKNQNVPGDIVEIGCNLGGTAIVAKRMLNNIESRKHYVCIDTFDGFIDHQFDRDTALGLPPATRTLFSGNSKALVCKILKRHGCGDVTLTQGDVTKLPDDELPDKCAVVLVDIDLTDPTYTAMARFYPRLSPGGAMLVDDCEEDISWKTRVAYSEFCHDHDLPEKYCYGMGIIEKSPGEDRG